MQNLYYRIIFFIVSFNIISKCIPFRRRQEEYMLFVVNVIFKNFSENILIRIFVI